MRASIQPGLERGTAHHYGRGDNTGEQHYVLQFSCLPDGAFPDKHPVERGGVCIFVEPLLCDLYFVSDRWSAETLRYHWRVCVHCSGHADRDGGDWLDGAAHPGPGVGRDFTMSGMVSGRSQRVIAQMS